MVITAFKDTCKCKVNVFSLQQKHPTPCRTNKAFRTVNNMPKPGTAIFSLSLFLCPRRTLPIIVTNLFQCHHQQANNLYLWKLFCILSCTLTTTHLHSQKSESSARTIAFLLTSPCASYISIYVILLLLWNCVEAVV